MPNRKLMGLLETITLGCEIYNLGFKWKQKKISIISPILRIYILEKYPCFPFINPILNASTIIEIVRYCHVYESSYSVGQIYLCLYPCSYFQNRYTKWTTNILSGYYLKYNNARKLKVFYTVNFWTILYLEFPSP